jgi:hypothetical protein
VGLKGGDMKEGLGPPQARVHCMMIDRATVNSICRHGVTGLHREACPTI